ILIFLSGATLVWKNSVDDLLHPQRQIGAAPAHAAPFYLAAAQRAFAPDERIASLTFPRSQGAVVAAAAGTGPGMGGRVTYYLHPASGAVLDRASMVSGPLRFAHILHGSLLLGRPGARVV